MINKTKDQIINDITTSLITSGMYSYQDMPAMTAWYNIVWDLGTLWFRYDEQGHLMGFIDGIRLHKEPHNDDEFRSLVQENPYNIGNIGVFINCVVLSGSDTLQQLISAVKRDNPVWDVIVWRHFKTGRYLRRENIRRKSCTRTVVC